nr:MAG TPA: hypothetical protein [Caudoviricetes sp.]
MALCCMVRRGKAGGVSRGKAGYVEEWQARLGQVC